MALGHTQSVSIGYWYKVAEHEAKMLGKNGVAVSPFSTCLIHSVVLP